MVSKSQCQAFPIPPRPGVFSLWSKASVLHSSTPQRVRNKNHFKAQLHLSVQSPVPHPTTVPPGERLSTRDAPSLRKSLGSRVLSERHRQELHQYCGLPFRREQFRLRVASIPQLSRVNEAFCFSLQMLKLARLASEPDKRNGWRGIAGKELS